MALLVCLAQGLSAGSEIAVRMHKGQLAAVPLFIGRPLPRQDLALDAQGEPHISYYIAGTRDLKYAHQSSGVWTTEVVYTAGYSGAGTSLALDAQGVPHIAFREGLNDALLYTNKKGGTWNTVTLDLSSDVQGGVSLALDSNDFPHISYWDNSSNIQIKC